MSGKEGRRPMAVASVTIPEGVYNRFVENLQDRGFTDKGDFSHEVDRAVRLYLDGIGAFEEVAELDRRCEAEDEKRREVESKLGFFHIADDLD